MSRLEALSGIASIAILFVPIFFVLFSADRMGKQREAMRQKRIADYKKSPESQLLILN